MVAPSTRRNNSASCVVHPCSSPSPWPRYGTVLWTRDYADTRPSPVSPWQRFYVYRKAALVSVDWPAGTFLLPLRDFHSMKRLPCSPRRFYNSTSTRQVQSKDFLPLSRLATGTQSRDGIEHEEKGGEGEWLSHLTGPSREERVHCIPTCNWVKRFWRTMHLAAQKKKDRLSRLVPFLRVGRGMKEAFLKRREKELVSSCKLNAFFRVRDVPWEAKKSEESVAG